VEWIQVAQDAIQWHALVNTVMNLSDFFKVLRFIKGFQKLDDG
jgi:hypothetical protein